MIRTGTAADATDPAAEQFALIRRISDDLAHELKNPLNAMVINLEVLRTRIRAGAVEPALERIAVLEQETRRLHELLDHMLRFLRPEPAGESRFPVAEVLDEVGTVVRVLAKLRRTGFQAEPPGQDLFVQGRREPLRFALLALGEAAVAEPVPAEPDMGDPAEVRLEAHATADGVRVQLEAPGTAAGRLAGAVAVARRLLAAEPVTIAADLGTQACAVRVLLPRA